MKLLILELLALLVLLAGCSHFANGLATTNAEQIEQARTSAEAQKPVIDALPDSSEKIALNHLDRDVTRNLGPSKNPEKSLEWGQDLISKDEKVRANANAKFVTKEQHEAELEAQKREYESKLLEMGKKYEAERNKTIFARFWAWSVGTFGLFGGLAFIVFCPAIALPLIGMVIKLLVTAFPHLISFFGLVSSEVFHSTVKGVDLMWNELKSQNQTHPLYPSQVESMLATNLRSTQLPITQYVVDHYRKTKVES